MTKTFSVDSRGNLIGWTDEARRLLKELSDEMALWRGNKPHAYTDMVKRARAFLTQPMTKCCQAPRPAVLVEALVKIGRALHPEPEEEADEDALVEHWGFGREECRNEFCQMILAALADISPATPDGRTRAALEPQGGEAKE